MNRSVQSAKEHTVGISSRLMNDRLTEIVFVDRLAGRRFNDPEHAFLEREQNLRAQVFRSSSQLAIGNWNGPLKGEVPADSDQLVVIQSQDDS